MLIVRMRFVMLVSRLVLQNAMYSRYTVLSSMKSSWAVDELRVSSMNALAELLCRM